MKLSISATTFVLQILSTLSVDAAFHPARISYHELLQGHADTDNTLRSALHEVGMIAITDIPSFNAKQKTLELLPECMVHSEETSRELIFSDGTRRRTMAVESIGTTDSTPLTVADHEVCKEFNKSSEPFRETVGLVMDTFADRLVAVFGLDASKPLLFDEANKEYSLKSIFQQGEHLEHFHCYYGKEDSQDDKTIEWHTDQGLALAFTPGLVKGQTTKGFFVQLSDGTTEMVDFQPKDDLVFLLGDGVNQYVNHALDSNEASLRALPHALHMPPTTSSSPRVWYGRMVLPPPDAMHPLHPTMTFGEIREGLMEHDDAAFSSIGCSQDLVVARGLSAENAPTSCDESSSSYCWHQCMNYTEYEVSPSICEAQSLDLACVNADGFLWDGTTNGGFFIECVDLALAENFTATEDGDVTVHGDGAGHKSGDDDDDDDDSSDSHVMSSITMIGVSLTLSAVLGVL